MAKLKGQLSAFLLQQKARDKQRQKERFKMDLLDKQKNTNNHKKKKKTTQKTNDTQKDQQQKEVATKKIPYSAKDQLLLIGEANFSFALALARLLYAPRGDDNDDQGGDSMDDEGTSESLSSKYPQGSITATTLDSKEITVQKYPDALQNLKALEKEFHGRVRVFFGVDGTRLEESFGKQQRATLPAVFHKIIFQFPHVGLGITDQHRNILANQKMILGFLKSARRWIASYCGSRNTSIGGYCLKPSPSSRARSDECEIHITIKAGAPYDDWNVKQLAKGASLGCRTSFRFLPEQYPGYAHRRTLGFQEGISSENNEELKGKQCRTYVFMPVESLPKMEQVDKNKNKKRKCSSADSDSDA